MSEQKFPRRTLLKGALLGAAAVPVSALLSRSATAASGRVDPNGHGGVPEAWFVGDGVKYCVMCRCGEGRTRCLPVDGRPRIVQR